MLFNCDRVSKIWVFSPFRLRPELTNSAQIRDIWKRVGDMPNGETKREAQGLFATLGWHVWTARNSWVFNQNWKLETKIVKEALEEFDTFLQATKKITAGT